MHPVNMEKIRTRMSIIEIFRKWRITNSSSAK
jgi:hypothetical protein